MLRALKRLLRRGGRIAFTTIYVPTGLGPTARRRAYRVGPRAVASRVDQRRLLKSAGFVEIDAVDLTEAFVGTTRGWIEEGSLHADELAALDAPGAFAQRRRNQLAQLAATEDGLLRRGLFMASRP